MDLQKIRAELEKSQICLKKIKSELEVSSRNYDLVILDDIFPLRFSAFRIAEYNYYLETFSRSLVLSTGKAGMLKNHHNLSDVIVEYENFYPHFEGRVRKFDYNISINARLIYTVFINNIFNFIQFIEKNNIPFVFTL